MIAGSYKQGRPFSTSGRGYTSLHSDAAGAPEPKKKDTRIDPPSIATVSSYSTLSTFPSASFAPLLLSLLLLLLRDPPTLRFPSFLPFCLLRPVSFFSSLQSIRLFFGQLFRDHREIKKERFAVVFQLNSSSLRRRILCSVLSDNLVIVQHGIPPESALSDN